MSAVSDRSLIRRMRGAALLDVHTFEEIEHDGTATGQAVGVVALAAVAQAVGASGAGPLEMVWAATSGVVGWLLFAGLAFLIGSVLFGGEATWGEVFRTLGFAQTPALLALLAGLPAVGWIVDTIVVVWVLWAAIVALRQALDVGTVKAVATGVLAGALWGFGSVVF